MPTVSNTGPLLTFARADRLDLLREVVSELIIPDAVHQEIVVRGSVLPGAAEVREGIWIKQDRVQDRTLIPQLPERLGLGEREALRLGIHPFGSLRLLQEAKSRGIIPRVKPVLDELMAGGCMSARPSTRTLSKRWARGRYHPLEGVIPSSS